MIDDTDEIRWLKHQQPDVDPPAAEEAHAATAAGAGPGPPATRAEGVGRLLAGRTGRGAGARTSRCPTDQSGRPRCRYRQDLQR